MQQLYTYLRFFWLAACLCWTLTSSAQTWKAVYPLDDSFNFTDRGQSAVNAAGEMYIVGRFTGTIQLGPSRLTSPVGYTSYLAKLNADGRYAWAKPISNSPDHGFHVVRVGPQDQVYLAGSFLNKLTLNDSITFTGAGGSRGVIACYSSTGTLRWAQPTIPNVSSEITDLQLDDRGSIAVTGFFMEGPTMGLGQNNPMTATNNTRNGGVWWAKLDVDSGIPQQVTIPMHSATLQQTEFYRPLLATGPNGDFFLTVPFSNSWQVGASTYLSMGRADIMVLRLTPDGALRWSHRLGHAANEIPFKTVADAQGNLYLVGFYERSTGTFDDVDLPNKGDFDGMLVRLSPNGKTEWAKALSSQSSDYWSDIFLTPNGLPVVVGTMGRSLQLGTTSLTSQGGSDALVAGYDAAGNLLWAQSAGGIKDDYGTTGAILANGELVVRGVYDTASIFGTHTLTANGLASFLGYLTPSVLATQAQHTPQLLRPYPNPATAEVSLPTHLAGQAVLIQDGVGRTVRTIIVSAAGKVSVLGLAPGLYSLRSATAQGQLYTGRLQVQ